MELAAAWAEPLTPPVGDPDTADGGANGWAASGMADDEWARDWAERMGLRG